MRDLRAAYPEIKSGRPTKEGKRINVVTGIRTRAAVENTPDTPDIEASEDAVSGVSGVYLTAAAADELPF